MLEPIPRDSIRELHQGEERCVPFVLIMINLSRGDVSMQVGLENICVVFFDHSCRMKSTTFLNFSLYILYDKNIRN